MNLNPLRSVTAQLGWLSVSIPRTSVRQASSKKKRREKIPPSFPPGHGEKIWIYSNFVNGQTVYSHDPVLKANRALRQLPFNGKKLKPAKLRKDYWRPMAMIQFPEGLGHIGRSVYHIMREFRQKHDLDWGDEMFRDDETGRPLTRFERGQKLNSAQKANAIADMAAVLGGVGKGNKMWLPASDQWETSKEQRVDEKTGETTSLLKTQVWWTNLLDKNYAQSWPDNVAHFNFTEGVYQPLDLQREAGATVRATPEATAESIVTKSS